jgi:hypothetical protein
LTQTQTFARRSLVCRVSKDIRRIKGSGWSATNGVLANDPTRDLKSRMGKAAEDFYPQVHDQLRAFFA